MEVRLRPEQGMGSLVRAIEAYEVKYKKYHYENR